MPLTIEHDGVSTTFPDNTLMIFVDETGNENLSDPNAPFFGIGGCFCGAGEYFSKIHTPWKKVEELFLPEQRPLHAADLNPKTMREEQFEALESFFSKETFGRFAAVVKADVIIEPEVDIIHLLVRATLNQIIEIISESREEYFQVFICIEHSQRLVKYYADYFQRYPPLAEDDTPIPVFYSTQAKSSGDDYLAGLTVSDFIAHTAGSTSRSTKGGTRRVQRRDFSVIFENKRARHIFIDKVLNRPSA